MVAAFPLAKLGYIAIRQISKPFATRIKTQAKSSHFFRTYICMPPAQFYHWVEVNVKMRMMNLGKPVEVPKLNEAMAIELGAELLGEGVVFGVAVACLVAEFVRSSLKEKEKEAARELRTEDLENRIYELEYTISEQEARIREMNRFIKKRHWFAKVPDIESSKVPQLPKQSPRRASTGAIDKAMKDAAASVKSQTDKTNISSKVERRNSV